MVHKAHLGPPLLTVPGTIVTKRKEKEWITLSIGYSTEPLSSHKYSIHVIIRASIECDSSAHD